MHILYQMNRLLIGFKVLKCLLFSMGNKIKAIFFQQLVVGLAMMQARKNALTLAELSNVYLASR